MELSKLLKQRNFGLDVIRSFAVLLVVVGHIAQFTMPYFKGFINILSGWFVCITGIYGVELFFVLSGFLIGQIIIKEYKKTDYGHFNIKKFYIRRWFRTLPLYYLFLFVYLSFFIFSNYKTVDFKPIIHVFFSYLVFLQNFFFFLIQGNDFKEPFAIYGQSWSLTIEEWFYLLLPLLFYLYKIANINIKKLYKNIIVCISIFLAMRIIVTLFFNTLNSGDIDRFIFIRFDSLLIGVLFACLKINNNEIYNKFLNKKFILIGFGIIFLLTFFLLSHLLVGDLANNFFIKTSFYDFLSFASVLLIINAENSPFINQKLIKINLIKNFFQKTSLYSYSIYLSHIFLLIIGINKFYISTSFLWINILLTFSVIYFAGFLLYNFFEKPLMDLREKF